jgi:hypothetical protein
LALAHDHGVGLPHQSNLRSTTASQADSTEECRTLDSLSENARAIDGIWADEVEPGDRLIVHTQNSVYSLTALPNGLFRVSGGWFSAQGLDEVELRIVGCTWGGRAILTRLIAAPGMCIEFDNTVQTTSVREVRLFRYEISAVRH